MPRLMVGGLRDVSFVRRISGGPERLKRAANTISKNNLEILRPF